MRPNTAILVAAAASGLFFAAATSASALPTPSRSDTLGKSSANTATVTEEVRYRKRGWRRGYGYRGGYGRYYRPYPYYGYYGYRPYSYGGWGYPYYRRPGFGIYLGF